MVQKFCNFFQNLHKCHIVHIGKSTDIGCSNLKVQNTAMKRETTGKYLGDHVNNTRTVKATIDERRARAFGLSAEIISTANSVPMGKWRMKSGTMLRQAMMVNGTLYNSEC